MKMNKKITQEQENELIEFIKNDKVINKYLGEHWVSGSSTMVYPIKVWLNDIEVQLKSNARSNYFQGFSKRIKEKFNLRCTYVRTDGSCPNYLKIYKYVLD